MKFSIPILGALAGLTVAQTPVPYTDAKSGITFNAHIDRNSGYFFGIALPTNTTGNTDFIATIGGKGTGYAGASLGGGMLGKLLVLAWPNGQNVVSSFRKTTNYGSPAVATGVFTQTPIVNGTYVNSTHWTYTFLCSRCILTDRSTFNAADASASIGWAINAQGPQQRTNAGASVSKHSTEGQIVFNLANARSANFTAWKGYVAPKVKRVWEA